MDDEKQEQGRDDEADAFIVEIQDLDGTEERKIFLKDSPARPVSPVQATRISLKSHRTSMQRRLRILTTVGLIFATIVLLLGSNTAVRSLVKNEFSPFSATPTGTPYPWLKLFYIDAEPLWGTLFVDGHMLKQLPIPGVNPPIQLTTGQHTILWTAVPFEPRQCTFSVPTDVQLDPHKCLLTVMSFVAPSHSAGLSYHAPIIASVIEFYPSLSNLSTSQRALLLRAAQTALDTKSATTILQKGALYTIGGAKNQAMTVAQEPLKARIHIVLDTNPAHACVGLSSGGGCNSVGGSCFLFCDANYFPGFALAPGFSQSSHDWYAYVMTHTAWDYTTVDGKAVALSQPDASTPLLQAAADQDGFSYMTLLHFTWDGKQWQASLFSPAYPQIDIPDFTPSLTAIGFSLNPICTTTWDELNRDGLYRIVGQVNQLANWRFISGSDASMGCLAIDTASGAYFWHRFGVTMAANSAAYRIEPALPHATTDASSQTIIQQLVSLEKR
jgi:hypothetical protein